MCVQLIPASPWVFLRMSLSCLVITVLLGRAGWCAPPETGNGIAAGLSVARTVRALRVMCCEILLSPAYPCEGAAVCRDEV